MAKYPTTPVESYEQKISFTIKRRAGNSGVIRVNIPPSISMAGMTIRFQARDEFGEPVFSKSNATDDGILVAGQQVSIMLLPLDTIDHIDTLECELDGEYSVAGCDTIQNTTLCMITLVLTPKIRKDA